MTNYPHQPLTRIIGVPNRATIVTLKEEVYANLASQRCSLGGGAHGYVALMMSAADYAALAPGNPFQAPIHPGPIVNHPAGLTGPQITHLNRVYDSDLAIFEDYSRVSGDVQAMIIAAVENTYIAGLRQPQTLYTNVTIEQLITHLETNYGTIKQEDLTKNLEAANASWDPAAPIEELWERFRVCREFAALGNAPITDSAILLIALDVITKTDAFPGGLRRWRLKPEADKTYDNFKAHFKTEHEEYKLEQTTKTAGYSGKVVPPEEETKENTPPKEKKMNEFGVPLGLKYCWSHGLQLRCDSQTCQNPREGHQRRATYMNPYLGCNRIHGPNYEKKMKWTPLTK